MLYRLIIIICLGLAFGAQPLVEAAERVKRPRIIENDRIHNERKQQHRKQEIISKASAIRSAKSEVNGKILSARLIPGKGPAVYRIKMLVGESRVRTVFVDGKNGKVIRIN